MQQFIEMATSALGTSEQAARTLTGSLLDVISRSAAEADVSALLARLPGSTELLQTFRVAAPAPPPPPDPGPLGSLTNAASAVLDTGSSVLGSGASAPGTGAAGLNSLATLCRQEGLEVTRMPQLVGLFARWAAQQAGTDVVRRALSSVPGVSVLLASPDLR